MRVKTKGNGLQSCAVSHLVLKGSMKLKKPAYREGIDFDAAYLTPTDADKLLELMKSEPFADNRVSYGPQVFPAPHRLSAANFYRHIRFGIQFTKRMVGDMVRVWRSF
jgi:hypothetical protein